MVLTTKFPKPPKRPKRPVNAAFRTHASEEPRFLSATLDRKSSKLIAVAAVGSIVAHIALFAVISAYARMPKSEPVPITVKIVPKKKEVIAEVKEEVPPKPKPEPKPEPKRPPPPKEKKVSSERKPPQEPVKPVQPVQGFSPDAVAKDGPGIAVPVGNTLMTGDDGTRLKPEDVKPLGNQDLSADPRLIRTSMIKPEYTDDAIDAGLEGIFTVDVYVDPTGVVTSADLTKKIGYGMDQRVLAAANKARFEPRKDRYGKAVAGWATITFLLELP